MKKFLITWNVMRVVRLLIGLAALVQGIVQKEGLLLAAGAWILLSVAFNLGCCGTGGCSVSMAKQKTKEKVVYEEVDVSK